MSKESALVRVLIFFSSSWPTRTQEDKRTKGLEKNNQDLPLTTQHLINNLTTNRETDSCHFDFTNLNLIRVQGPYQLSAKTLSFLESDRISFSWCCFGSRYGYRQAGINSPRSLQTTHWLEFSVEMIMASSLTAIQIQTLQCREHLACVKGVHLWDCP